MRSETLLGKRELKEVDRESLHRRDLENCIFGFGNGRDMDLKTGIRELNRAELKEK